MEQERLIQLLTSSAVIVGLAAAGLIVVHLAGRRAAAWVRSVENVRRARRQQMLTLVTVVQWTLVTLLVISALLMLLGTFGIDIAPILASAGVAGLAVSLAAQSLIKDLIGGMLIIIENQYAVGDSIIIGQISGEVERITLRVTQVRAVNGDLHTVPNGEVRAFANQTRGWSRASVELGIAYEEDLERALEVLRSSAQAFGELETTAPNLLEPPRVLGPVRMSDSALMVRVDAKTEPGMQWQVGRELIQFVLAACEREGIELPYRRQEVYVRGPAAPAPGEAPG
jgi:small conductance mechanosensitive channel